MIFALSAPWSASLAAMTTSVASSPIFFRKASGPWCSRRATYLLAGSPPWAILRLSMTAARRARMSCERCCKSSSGMGFSRRWPGGLSRPHRPPARRVAEPAEKAAMAPGMAGNAGLVALLRDPQQQHITVAIEADLVHRLRMARVLALEPQLAARAAEVHGAPECCGLPQRLAVHPGQHQHVARALLLRDHRHQALRIPFHVVEPVHRCDCR